MIVDRRRWVTLAVLCVTLLLVTLDTTVLNVALPTIVRSMHATSSELQWIVDAYVIVFAGLLLVLGSLGDRTGRKWIFVGGLAVFAVGSACSALSTSPDRLIASRTLMGIGAAAIMPSTLSILANVFTDARERAWAIGIWTGASGLGVAAGPVIGGWLLSHFWWGSVFLINVPIALVGIVAALLVVPNSANPASERPDPIGALLSIVGMGLLLWAIIEAPTNGWTSTTVLAALASALVVLGVLALFERRSTHPMLRLEFFRSARFSVGIATLGLAMFALLGSLFLLTQYLQFSLAYSPLQAGVRVAPIAAVLFVAAPLSVLLVRRVGSKIVVFFGMALVGLGLLLCSRVTIAGSYLDVLPALFLIGIGVGLSLAPCIECVIGSLPPDEAGIGSATSSAIQQTGAALGVGVLGSLLNSRYEDRLTPVLAHYAMPHPVLSMITGSLGGALGVAARVGGVSGRELATFARMGFISGMDLAVLVGAIVVAAAALLALAVLPSRAPPRRRHDPEVVVPRPNASALPSSSASDHRVAVKSRQRRPDQQELSSSGRAMRRDNPRLETPSDRVQQSARRGADESPRVAREARIIPYADAPITRAGLAHLLARETADARCSASGSV